MVHYAKMFILFVVSEIEICNGNSEDVNSRQRNERSMEKERSMNSETEEFIAEDGYYCKKENDEEEEIEYDPFGNPKRCMEMKGSMKSEMEESIEIGHYRKKEEEKIEYDPFNNPQERIMIEYNFCRICKVHFRFASHYEDHFEMEHVGIKPYSCPHCDYDTRQKKTLFLHITTNHPGQSNLIRRQRSSFECGICQVVFISGTLFEKHALSKHSGVRMMKCSECEIRYFRRNVLLEHICRKHRMLNMHCKNCKGSFTRSDVLEKHELQCMEKLKSRLQRHRNKLRREQEKRKYRRKSRGKNFRCLVCGEEFSGVKAYEAHGNTEHPREPLFKCGICSYGLLYKKTLQAHVKSQHGESEFACCYCDKLFRLVGERNRHQKACTTIMQGRREFYCDICQKTWRGISEWHMKDHDSYDYCAFCNKRFHREKNPKGLTSHIFLRHPSRSIDVNAFERAAHILQCKEEEK